LPIALELQALDDPRILRLVLLGVLVLLFRVADREKELAAVG